MAVSIYDALQCRRREMCDVVKLRLTSLFAQRADHSNTQVIFRTGQEAEYDMNAVEVLRRTTVHCNYGQSI